MPLEVNGYSATFKAFADFAEQSVRDGAGKTVAESCSRNSIYPQLPHWHHSMTEETDRTLAPVHGLRRIVSRFPSLPFTTLVALLHDWSRLPLRLESPCLATRVVLLHDRSRQSSRLL